MGRKKILQDLQIGSLGEKKVVELLTLVGFKCENTDGKKNDIILYVDDRKYTVEVKFDLYSSKSGNIALEIFNTRLNQHSGIAATACDFWAHIADDVYFVRTEILRSFIESNPPHREVHGGDDNSYMKLYKKDAILPIFLNLTEIAKDKNARQLLEGYILNEG